MIEVIPALPDHLDEFEPKKLFEAEKKNLHILKKACLEHNCLANSFVLDGKIIGCVGGCYLQDRSLLLWGWLSENVKKRPIDFCKKSLLVLTHYIKTFHPKEVLMYVRKGFRESFQWAKFLGFKEVAVVTGSDGTEYHKMMRAPWAAR